MPTLEDMIKKLECRKEADPLLSDMIKDLREAIDLEAAQDKVLKAKLDYID